MALIHPRALGWCSLLIAVTMAWCGVVMASDSLPEPSNGDAGEPVQAHSGATRAHFQNLLGSVRGSLTLAAGLRFDQFDWSIAGNAAGTNPNILSELEWSQVFSHQVQLGGWAKAGRYLYGRGHVAYAAIQSGTVRDSDYRDDHRIGEYSRSVCDTNDDQLWDVVAGIGYPFLFMRERLLFAPMVGFSIHKQNFRITNGRQVISGEPPPGTSAPPDLGPLNSRLNSTYEALWWGPWIGCDLHYQMAAPPNQAAPMAWTLGLMYHFRTDFSAEATWNLRENFRQPRSFEQTADGHGVTIHAEWLMRVKRYLNVSLQLHFTQWSTDAGTDSLFLANGAVIETRLNPVSRQAHSVMVGLNYRF